MRILQVTAAGLMGFAALACGPSRGESQLPTAPQVTGTQAPPPLPPPLPAPPLPQPPPPGARRIELGSVIREDLRNWPIPVGCPVDRYFDEDLPLPCRHFEVVAPGDGTLQVEVNWFPQPAAERVMLFTGGITYPIYPRRCDDPQIGRHRVLANAIYGITIAYCSSHWEYILDGPELIGEFTLKATFER